MFVDLVESTAVRATIANATSGETLMTVSEAIIDAEEPRMYIPDHASIHIHDLTTGSHRVSRKNNTDRDPVSNDNNEDSNDRRRLSKGPSTIGQLQTLVIRLTDKNNVSPTSNVAKLVNDVFTDSVSLKTQTHACSYGKLNIEPFHGNTPSNTYINNGVVDIQMDYVMGSNAPGMDQAALKAAQDHIGDLNDPMFDLLLFCFPPGETDFLAFAYPSSKFSFYNDEWCGFVAAQMHEVGHNLGLAHSGQSGESEYGDQTGYMGGSPGVDDFKMCFNPQKSYQLGWYEDQTQTFNPLDGTSQREFILNGVSDYQKNTDAFVVLRMRQLSKEQDYYIGYNRATGINEQSGEDKGAVTIVRKEYGSPKTYAQSTKIAALQPGQRIVIPNYNGSNESVQIAFTGLKDNGDARIIVLDNDQPPPLPPGSCKHFTVELVTDEYPDDNKWYIKDKGDWGRIAAISMLFPNPETEYRQVVCLPQGKFAKNYLFAIEDKYGDGMRGNAGYRVFNDQGQLQFEGGSEFTDSNKIVFHNIMVPEDPDPPPPTESPTKSPTQAPTQTPPCRNHFVEVKTDGYPGDSSWQFVTFDAIQDEQVFVESTPYTDPGTETTTVCLYEGWDYVFRFKDDYGDGLCCGGSSQSKGYYKVTDALGTVVVDSGQLEDDFKQRDYPFTVTVGDVVVTTPEIDPTQSPVVAPTPAPTKKKSKCKNSVKKKFKVDPSSKKKNCKWYAKKKKCDETIDGGKQSGNKITDVCKKSCKAC